MKNGDLIKSMAKNTALSIEESELVLGTITESIGEALAKGKTVQLYGFGTFSVRKKETHPSNPSLLHENGHINEPVFTPGKVFRDAVKKTLSDKK